MINVWSYFLEREVFVVGEVGGDGDCFFIVVVLRLGEVDKSYSYELGISIRLLGVEF